MFASNVIGRCKHCKKSGRLKHESASYAWSAARFCQNLWIEGFAEQNATTSRNGVSTVIQQQCRAHHSNSNRHGMSTARWHGNTNREGQQLSRSTTIPRRSCEHNTWLFPIIQQRKYSTRITATPPTQFPEQNQARNKQSGTDITTDREMVLSAALEQSSASTAHSLIDIMFRALRQVNNPKLAWECYTDLTLRNMLHYLTRDQFRELIRLFRRAFSHTQALEYILTFVDDMDALGYRIGRKEKLVVMRLLGMNGKLDEMEQVFHDLKEQDKLLLGAVLDEQDAQKPFHTMFDMYQLQKDLVGTKHMAEKSLSIYGEMIELGIRPGPAATRLLMENIRGAGTTYDIVESVWSWFWNKVGMNVGGKTVDLEPSLYREMVLYFASAGRAEYALEVNDLMVKRKIQRDVRVGTALIHKVGRSGNLERAVEIFDEMTRIDGVEPTLVTFNALIDIHAHKFPEPDIEGASRMYQKLQEYGLKPDIATIGPLIDMFAKQGDTDMVRRLYRDLVDNQHLKPNEHIYSSLIECFLKHDDRKSALDILHAMGNTPSSKTGKNNNATMANQVAYNLMIRSFVRDNDLKGAFNLLDLMVKSKLRPESRTFTPLLGLLADQGNLIAANKVVEMMGKIGTRMDIFTHTALLEAHTKAGDIRGAERLFQKMKHRYRLNTQTYNVLMYGYIKKNEMDMVLDTYRRMVKSFVPMNEYTYGILMYYFSRRKEPEAVESLLTTMKKNHIRPRVISWTILMQSYFESELYEDGFRVYDRMKNADIDPNYVTHSLLIATCARTGDLELAETILARAVDQYENYKPEQQTNQDPLADAGRSSRTEKYSYSLPKLVDEMLKERQELLPPGARLPPHLFDPLINAYANRSDFSKAKQTFGHMMDLGVKVSIPAYITLMNMYKNEERLDIVEHLWNHLRTREADPVPMQELDPELGSDIPLPVAVKDELDLLFARDDALPLEFSPFSQEQEQNRQQLNAISPYAVSIYIDTLTQQQRFDDVNQLWDELTENQYPFDEHNWNRYLTSLAESGNIEQAASMTLKYLDEYQENAQQSIRSRDNLTSSDDQKRQLYNRTYRALAEMLDISIDGLTDRQLYDVVLGTLQSNNSM